MTVRIPGDDRYTLFPSMAGLDSHASPTGKVHASSPFTGPAAPVYPERFSFPL